MGTEERRSVYRRVTDQIIAAIERGAGDFRLPWNHDGAPTSRPENVESGKRYRGSNTLTLWVAAEEAGYARGLWGTYRQWQERGAQVRKGERATLIVFWKSLDRHDEADEVDAVEADARRRLIARGYSVFNVSQVEGYRNEHEEERAPLARIAHADAFFDACEIKTEYGGDRAFYHPATDTVHLPPYDAFVDVASAQSTRAHEYAHATGAPHRLARDLSGRFGSESYAFEEIIAQLAAGFVLADLGIAHVPREDDTAYIASWLSVLKNDDRAIFAAASKAQAAADWMHAMNSR
jgi:antirestriction protein ArdC